MPDERAEGAGDVAAQAQRMAGQAWAAVGGGQSPPTPAPGVTFERCAPDLLPARTASLPAVLAAVAASTQAAAALDAVRRHGPVHPVVVDAEHVALAVRSERYARRGSAPPQAGFAPLSRFYRSADGWVRLHANYSWHHARALDVLGVAAPTSDADHDTDATALLPHVTDAVAGWRGADLEDALADAGALGFAVRTPAQWHAHPQGRAVATLPLVGMRSLTTDPAAATGHLRRITGRDSSGTARAAQGIRVLDLTRVIAGPVATRTLAAWGADVVRVDSPHLPEIPAQAVDTLPGKRSATLDFATREGRARVEELLAQADVLVQGYRPGALTRFGLDRADLAERHPHLSVVSVSAWGPAGPWARRRGFDSLVQCPTGIAAVEGTEDEPGVLPAQVLDHATGYLAAAAALLAVAATVRGEPPRAVQLSLAQTARWLLDAGLTRGALAAERPQRPERHLVTLPGAGEPVSVVAPPGRAGDLTPRWHHTTDLGADAAAFDAGPPGAGRP